MKKLLITLFVLVFLAGAAGVGALYYIRPDPELTLANEPVPVKQRALDMVKRLSVEMILNEEDVNNALKKSLADNPQRGKDVVVQGANFDLQDDLLVADLSLLWRDRIPTAMQVTYRLAWKSPNLVATVEQVKVKDITLPSDTVGNLSFPIGQELPKPLKIRDLKFDGDEIRLQFQKPSIADLKELIG